MINDMPETIEEIFKCTGLPMSIIIVGIGKEADFTDMRILDGDEGLQNSRG